MLSQKESNFSLLKFILAFGLLYVALTKALLKTFMVCLNVGFEKARKAIQAGKTYLIKGLFVKLTCTHKCLLKLQWHPNVESWSDK